MIENLRHIQQQTNNPSYLCGEYGAELWQPFYVAEVHRLAAAHKLDFVASATLPENHPSLLSNRVAAVIEEERDPLIRQALLDIAINQSFRQDLFIKGAIPLTRAAKAALLAQQVFCCLHVSESTSTAQADPIVVNKNLGLISIDSALVDTLLALLRQAPASLAEIHQVLGKPVDDLIRLTSLLLDNGWIGLERGAALPTALQSCQFVNQRLLDLIQAGNNLTFIASPVVGHGGVGISVLDVFILSGIQQGLDGDVLAGCVWMGMTAARVEIRNREGDLLTDPERCLTLIKEHIESFISTGLPRLKLLGIVQ